MNPQIKKYHSNVSEYFLNKPLFFDKANKKEPNIRKLGEQPYQQFKIHDWDKLVVTLYDPTIFEFSWENNKWNVLQWFTAIKNGKGVHVNEIFKDAIIQKKLFVSPTLTWFLSTLMMDLGYTNEAISLFSKLQNYYFDTGDKINMLYVMENLAQLFLRIGKSEESLKYVCELETFLKRMNAKEFLIRTKINKAFALISSEKYDEAFEIYEEYKNQIESFNDKEYSNYFNGLGILQWKTKKLEDALKSFEKSSKFTERAGDLIGHQAAIGNQGGVLLEMGKTKEAIKMLGLQISICQKIGNKEGMVGALANLGRAYIKDDPEKALFYHFEEKRISMEINFHYGYKQGLANKGEALIKLEMLEDAFAEFKEYLAVCEKDKDIKGMFLARHNLAAVSQLQGIKLKKDNDMIGASEKYRQMIFFGKENGESDIINLGQKNLIQLLDRMTSNWIDKKEYYKALDTLKELAQIYIDRNDKKGLEICYNNSAIVNGYIINSVSAPGKGLRKGYILAWEKDFRLLVLYRAKAKDILPVFTNQEILDETINQIPVPDNNALILLEVWMDDKGNFNYSVADGGLEDLQLDRNRLDIVWDTETEFSDVLTTFIQMLK